MATLFHRNPPAPRIAVVGAGTIGPLMALTLRGLGHQVRVYEQTREPDATGTGLVLSTNALGSLKAFGILGVHDVIVATAQPIERFSILDRRGRTLRTREEEALAVDSSSLRRILFGALPEEIVERGRRCVDCIQQRRHATVIFDENESVEVDAVIGCDGMHSVVRRAIFPELQQRFAGYACWRGIARRRPRTLDPEQASESWGRGRRFGLVPLREDRVAWYACVRAAKPGDPALADVGLPELRELFSDFHPPLSELLGETAESSLTRQDVFEFRPMPFYAKGRILVLGDAAHAATPDLGEAAAQAFDDAAELASLLAREPLSEAFAQFSSARIRKANAVVARTRLYGRMARLQNPLAVGVRDLLVKVAAARLGKAA